MDLDLDLDLRIEDLDLDLDLAVAGLVTSLICSFTYLFFVVVFTGSYPHFCPVHTTE